MAACISFSTLMTPSRNWLVQIVAHDELAERPFAGLNVLDNLVDGPQLRVELPQVDVLH